MMEAELISEDKLIAAQYKELLRISYLQLTDEDKKLIRKAFDRAVDAHKEQRRKSGEAYIFHPIAVAKIVASEIGMDATSIAAALLHDVIEDTKFTYYDIKNEFGEKVADIVNGLTKISSLKKDTEISTQAENFRKMLLTLNDDIRVVIIKLADRLHNMQTMDAMPQYKQMKIASETLFIYAPIAHRIGMYNIKTELEDLSLKYTQPEKYQLIVESMNESNDEQQGYIQNFIDLIQIKLDKQNLTYTIKGRNKSIYSIYKKMESQGIEYNEVYDKFAVRIVYESGQKKEAKKAWKIYSTITSSFKPNPIRLRDWISSPKSNGYESLHTTVLGPKNKWIEVQIRSQRMDDIAEKGYAAHFQYKHGHDKVSGIDDWLNKLKDLFENSEINAVDFVEDFRLNLYSKEIYVYTPKGKIITLPKGATVLDFAYSIHTDIGNHLSVVRVNNVLAPYNRTLKSGDHIKVITSDTLTPTPNWLYYAKTSKAKTSIRHTLTAQKKERTVFGEKLARRKLLTLKIKLNPKVIKEMLKYFKVDNEQDLYYRFGIKAIDNSSLRDFANQYNSLLNFVKNVGLRKKQKNNKEEEKPSYIKIVFGKEKADKPYHLSRCCRPISGDEIFGLTSLKKEIEVHTIDCVNAISLQAKFGSRIIQASWIDSLEQRFTTIITLVGIDKVGLVNEITQKILNFETVLIRKLSFENEDNMFKGTIQVSVIDKRLLNRLILNLKQLHGVDKVTRE